MMTADKLRAARNAKIIRKVKAIETIQDQLEDLRVWAHKDFGTSEKSTKHLTSAINSLMDAAHSLRQFEWSVKE